MDKPGGQSPQKWNDCQHERDLEKARYENTTQEEAMFKEQTPNLLMS